MLAHFLLEINAPKSKALIKKHQPQPENRKQKNNSLSAKRNSGGNTEGSVLGFRNRICNKQLLIIEPSCMQGGRKRAAYSLKIIGMAKSWFLMDVRLLLASVSLCCNESWSNPQFIGRLHSFSVLYYCILLIFCFSVSSSWVIFA